MDNFQGIPREISYNSATSLSVEENQQDKDQTKGNAITDEQLMLLRDRGDVVSPKVFKPNL